MSDIQEAIDEIKKAFSLDDLAHALNDNMETILEALKLAQEVEQGKAHVMRWVDMPSDAELDWPAHQMLGYIDEEDCYFMSNYLSGMEENNFVNSYATFNGLPSIPEPKEERNE